MAKYTKEYVNNKISNCRGLVENAISEAQREIYRGYLDFWLKKKPMDTIKDLPIVEDLPVDWEGLEEVEYAADFEADNPNKQAYYNRDGKTHKTKAFKEYLKSVTK